jgi:hypothetical protein
MLLPRRRSLTSSLLHDVVALRCRCFMPPLLRAAAVSRCRYFSLKMLHAADTSRRRCNTTSPLHTTTSNRRFSLMLLTPRLCVTRSLLRTATAPSRHRFTQLLHYVASHAAVSCRRCSMPPLFQADVASSYRCFRTTLLHAATAIRHCYFTLSLYAVASA